MKFKEYDTFILKKPIPNSDVPVRTVGVVLMILDEKPAVYEVEFPDSAGSNIGSSATFTISEEHMERAG